jgi:hypothetical protein
MPNATSPRKGDAWSRLHSALVRRFPCGSIPLRGERQPGSRVSGVTFKNDDGSDRQAIITKCRPGEELNLTRDPADEFDSGAVKVIRGTGDQIGFLPAHMTRDGDPSGIAHKMDSGTTYRCRVIEVTGGGPDRHYAINIEITDGDWPRREETTTPEISSGLWLLLLAASVILAAIWLLGHH